MRFLNKRFALGATLLTASSLLVGCQEELTQEDVNEERREAHEVLQDARDDAHEARVEADRQIAMIERERRETVADLQNKLHDPDTDPAEVRAEIADTNRVADEKIAEVRRDAADDLQGVHEEAQEELNEARATEQQYEMQQARDKYVAATEQTLAQIDRDIELLDSRSERAEVAETEAFDESLDLVEERRDSVDEHLDALKSAEVTEWKTYQDEVETSLQQLKSAYDAAAAELQE